MECDLDLGCKSIPQLERKIAVHCGQRCNERIFECLNCAFPCVDTVVVQLNELQFAIVSVHLNDLKAISVIGIVGVISVIGVYHKYSRID